MLCSGSLQVPIVTMAGRGRVSDDIPYMWNLNRNDANELTKQRLTDLEYELTAAGEKG